MPNRWTTASISRVCAELGDLARARSNRAAFRDGITDVLRRWAEVDCCMLISLSPYRTVPNPTALAGDYRTLSLSSAEPEVVGTTWAEDLLRRRGSYYNDEVLARAPDLFPVPQFRWM